MELPFTPHRCGALPLLAALLATPVAEAGFGRTPGWATVSADGEAQYSVPIVLPPGTNGMTPIVSLDYGHRNRGGLIGVGWSIGGLSQITRCARTFAQDGVAAPPLRTSADRFCLDGQRLVVANGAFYEAPNAEYRTEIESFARIRAFAGSSGNGPAYFTVESADGRIYEYGATSDASIDGAASPPSGGARTWALSRIRDRSGNVIDYRYVEETGNTAFRIASIHYNANPAKGVAASHEVAFVYQERPNREIDTGYVAGMPVHQIVRLHRVEVRHEGAVLRRYNLAYEPALSAGGRSRLAAITECGAGGADCLAPTTFEWQDGKDGVKPVAGFSAQLPGATGMPEWSTWNLADVNGDGRNDYVWAGGTNMASATVRYRLSLADGSFGPAIDTAMPCPRGIGTPFDANADGHADLLLISTSLKWSIALGSATGLRTGTDTGIAVPVGTRDFRGADLDGDGLGDIAWSEAADPMVNSLRVRVRFAVSSGGYDAPVTLYSQWDALAYQNSEGGDFIGIPGRRIDLDGDGAEELLMNENYTIARLAASEFATDRFDSTFVGAVPLDVNDDGCTDLAYRHQSGFLRVRLSVCNVASSATDLLGPASTGAAELRTLDWNGDGRDDILLRGAANWMVALSTGDAIAPPADTGIPHEGAFAIGGRDLDGDGLEDIAQRLGNQVRARFRAGPVPDLLSLAQDGFGLSAGFSYRPLTDPSVYVAGSAAAWPDQDLQTNDMVVSELATTDASGLGHALAGNYRYAGFRRNVQGRGSLGFRKITITDQSADEPLRSEITRRQDFPYTGLPESVVLRQSSGKVVSDADYHWSKLDLGPSLSRRIFPYPASVTTRRYEAGGILDGSEITRTVRTVAAVDPASGLVTDSTTTTTETGGGSAAGSSASVRLRFPSVLSDISNWCLGRPLSIEVTASHTLAGGAAIERTAEQSWNGLHCRPTGTRLFPADGALQVTYNFGYDSFGNIASEKITGVGVPARTVTTSWGARGQLPVRTGNPLGQGSRYDWNLATGQPLSFTDPNGLSIRWEYDAHGRPVRESQPDGARSEWKYEACQPGCDARARYRIRQNELDGSGNVRATMLAEIDQYDRAFRVETSQPGGARSASLVDYDARGRIARRHLPHWDGGTPPGYWSFDYDAIGRPTGERLHGADGDVARSNEWRYDGLAVSQLDLSGRSTTATRSAWGRMTEVVDALGGRTRYEHDAFGGLTLVRDASNNTVAAIRYDLRGRKTSVADMDRGSWTWTRNSLGETTALRDARGKLAQFEYDPLGRLIKRTDADGAATWNWGAAAAKRNVGRLVALAGPGYSETLTYDGVGRPATHTITSDAAYQFDYAYNSLGLLDSITYPFTGAGNRFRVRHNYDAGRVSRIWNVNEPGASLWQLNAQDAAGNGLDETLGDVRLISGFSPVSGDLEYQQATVGAGMPIQDLAYDWDAAGNLASRRDLLQGLVEDFRYDGLDRLLQTRRNGSVNLEVDYDPIGNMRRKSDVCPGTGPCYTYHAARKHAVVSAGTRTYAYDANGNMTSRNGGAIAWNAANLPISIADANGNNSQFAYGPDGNRWRQIARDGGTTETTTYASGLFEKVARGTATAWRHHVATPGGAAIHYRYGDGSSATTRYLTLDHIGSTDRVLDGAGSVFLSESFSAFGARRKPDWTGVPTTADLARIAAVARDGFTGHEHLDNLGLIHMNGRVYDPALGRFISADPYVTLPYDGQGLNRYSYALNNPLVFTDPSGYDPIPCLATQSGNCVQITVIAASWPSYLRATGGAHASEVASALERDPCGQNGSGSACSMQGIAMVAPATVVFTVGQHPDPTLRSGGRLDAVQAFAARVANLAISSSPVALLFGADPDFQYFREPGGEYGRLGANLGNVGYLAGGAAGVVRKGGASLFSGASSAVARSFQGRGRYPGIDRFRDITLKKGTILYAGYPGQSAFYTTASAMRRASHSSSSLFRGLQVAAHDTKGLRSRAAAFEVMEDTPAAFGLALANMRHGDGWLPQVVVPSYETSLRFLNDFPLAP